MTLDKQTIERAQVNADSALAAVTLDSPLFPLLEQVRDLAATALEAMSERDRRDAVERFPDAESAIKHLTHSSIEANQQERDAALAHEKALREALRPFMPDAGADAIAPADLSWHFRLGLYGQSKNDTRSCGGCQYDVLVRAYRALADTPVVGATDWPATARVLRTGDPEQMRALLPEHLRPAPVGEDLGRGPKCWRCDGEGEIESSEDSMVRCPSCPTSLGEKE